MANKVREYTVNAQGGISGIAFIDTPAGGPGGGTAWGAITGTLSDQTDLQTALNAKGTSNFDGVYSSLTGKPTLFDGVYSSLTGKPTLFDGVYSSLTGKPTLGTAAATASTDYATAAQGTKADSALQSISNGSITNAMLAGSIDLASKVTGQLPFANGGVTGNAATSATTGTMTVSMTTRLVTITPTGACTFNASGGGTTGQEVTFMVTTSGTSSFVLTFGTSFHKTGTLATGTTSARFFTVNFISDGTNWWETSRTAVQT